MATGASLPGRQPRQPCIFTVPSDAKSVVPSTLWQQLLLLGFDPERDGNVSTTAAGRARSRSRMSSRGPGPDMFRQSNETGLIAVLHFLFSKLSPAYAERFRGCYPPYDSSSKRQFRSTAHAIIQELQADGVLPRHLCRSSLLNAASGDRVYELLLHIATHTVTAVLARPPYSDAHATKPRPRPVETAPAQSRAELARLARALQARTMAEAAEFRRRARRVLALQQRWRSAAAQLRAALAQATQERDALSEHQAEWEATVPAAVFSAQAAVQRSSVVPKLRYCWGMLDQFVHSQTFADGEARMGDFVERHRRAASVRIDGGKMQAQLAAAVQDRGTDRGVAASIQSVCVSATDGAQGSGAGESGSTTKGSVDLVALVQQWTVSLRRLVSALLAVRHRHGHHGGSTFHRVQAWAPALGDAVRVLSDRVANARMLVSQLRQLCPELESSIQALEAAIYAADASGNVLDSPGRRAGRREREATQHLAMATPAGAYAPRSLAGLHSESRSSRRSAHGDRDDDGGGVSGGLTTVVRPTLPRGTFSAGRPAAVASHGVGSGTRGGVGVGVGAGASTAGQGAATARLSTHVEASPSAEAPTPGGDDSPVARQLTFG